MRIGQLLSFFILFVLFSCGKKEDKFELRHDSINFSAPLFDPGTYTAAVKFSSEDLSSFSGKELTKVTFYTLDDPGSCELTIFKNPSESGFGEVLYSANVKTKEDTWNQHKLSNSISLPEDEIWIGVTFSHATARSVIGCDAGPAVLNGEWLFTDTLQTLNNFKPDVDINWNIRGFVK